MYVVIAILVFGLLIAIHEFGHFITAKLCGVKVNEFAIGMGPALWKKQKGETLYALRVLPIGGYCAMEAEDEESDDPKAFTNQGFFAKLLILCAGSFMNFLLGLILVLSMTFVIPYYASTTVESFMDGCPYNSVDALQPGDRFYSIDGRRVRLSYNISDFLAQGDGTHDITVVRNGEKIKLNDMELTPREYEGYEGLKYGFIFELAEMNFQNRLSYTWDQSMEFARLVWMSLGEIVHGNVSMDDIAGPVGIVDLMNEAGESASAPVDAFYSMAYLAAFIAINLAIMNMLPIPALDGGRVFLLIVGTLIEKITHRKPDPRIEGYIHAIGLVLLLGFMVLIMYNDIVKIVIR